MTPTRGTNDQRRFFLRGQTRAPVESLEPRRLFSANFMTPVLYGGVNAVAGIAAGDLNGDGNPDVVVDGYSPSANVPVVGVYLNSNNAHFGSPTLYPIAGVPTGIALGNFTGSGKLGIAVVDTSSNTLDVFLGDGSGNFTLGAGATLSGTSGDTAVAVGDFNGDGEDDVAVVDPNDQAVQILFSNGDGSFTSAQTIDVPNPENVIVTDLNGDDHPDLAILSENGSIYAALNEGNGMFGAPVAYPLGADVTSAAGETFADFTGDHFPDLVGAGTNGASGGFGTLINQDNGTFAAAADTSISFPPTAVVAGDFTGDGNSDLALLNSGGALSVVPGNGNGTFGTPVQVFTNQLNSVGNGAVATDFNGSGTLGIAYVSNASGESFGITLDPSGSSTIISMTLVPTVTKNTLPGTVVGGTAQRGTAVVHVTNNTSAAVKGPVTVGLYATQDGAVDSSSVLVGTIKKSLSIKAGATGVVSVPLTVPRTLPAGMYTLLASTTDPSKNVTTATVGQSLTVQPPLISLAETFQRLVLPAAVVSGTRSASVASVRITNSGNILSNGTTTIGLYASTDGIAGDGTLIKSVTRRLAIKPGGSVVVPVPLGSYPSVSDGNYAIVAQVTDPDGAVSSVASTATVNIAGAYIDLAGSFVSVPATGTVGKFLSIRINIANGGNTLAAGNLAISFAASPNADGSDSFNLSTITTRISLKPGTARTVPLRVALPTGTPDGDVYLVATIDPNDLFDDSNLSNNVAISAAPVSIGS